MKNYLLLVCSIGLLAIIVSAQAPPGQTQPSLKPEVKSAILELQRDIANLQVEYGNLSQRQSQIQAEFAKKSGELTLKLASAAKDSGLDGYVVDPATLAVTKHEPPAPPVVSGVKK